MLLKINHDFIPRQIDLADDISTQNLSHESCIQHTRFDHNRFKNNNISSNRTFPFCHCEVEKKMMTTP